MIYRQLGRTGLKVSQLGFGAMRLPMVGEGEGATVNRELAIPMIHRAFEAGVNYIDTAVGYCNYDSQRAVGEALKGWRDRIIVSTKNPYYGEDEKEWWGNLEQSLERLQITRVDVYNHHGLSWKAYEEQVEPRVSKWMKRAKDQGLIRHICFSFHDNNEALMKLAGTGYGDAATVQYNMLDRSLEKGIARAHEKGMGIVVMGPVGGGRLGSDNNVLSALVPEIRRVPELALRFVLANPNVSVALSGMATMKMVEENVLIASDPRNLTAEEYAAIDAHLNRLKGMAELYCTACGYCKPCQAGIDIPRVFDLYNRGRIYGIWDSAREEYRCMPAAQWFPAPHATDCTQCGECEEKCPQKISIRAQLGEAHDALMSTGKNA
ncbi:MAG: aldo/keto reductase [bacterium]|nr:aldo/keto reductase [Candidatus Sumerlaeota bacterium]